ncbi:MAG: hypothetical protein GY754_17595 [bacterium]|nr:hypothetical protein [bacterium]
MKIPTKILAVLFVLGLAAALFAMNPVKPLNPRAIGLGVVQLQSGSTLRSAAPANLDYQRPMFFRSASMHDPFGTYCKAGKKKYTFTTTAALNLVVIPGKYNDVVALNEFAAHPDGESAEKSNFNWRKVTSKVKLENVKAVLLDPNARTGLNMRSNFNLARVKELIGAEAVRIFAKARTECAKEQSEIKKKYNYLCSVTQPWKDMNPWSYAAPLIFGVNGIDGWVSLEYDEVVLFGRPGVSSYYTQKNWNDHLNLTSSPDCN